MRSYAVTLLYGAVFVGVCASGITAQSPNTVAAHVAAARAAADDTWLILYSELCGAALGAGGRASSLPPAPGAAAGAKFLQDTYGAKILMSETDWTMVAQPPRGGGPPAPMAKKDGVITDGQKLTLGDTTITMYLTPGHTLGTTSLIIPVKDKGTTHMAAFWGGTAISRTSPYDNLVAYSSSARRFEDVAAKAGADVLLSNHGRYFDLDKRIGANRANPAGPNAFILTPARVRSYMQVADHCAQAIALAQNAAKGK